MKFAYADPPYLGCSERHYGDLHDAAADYDRPETHQALINRMNDEFDGWALSLHSPSLHTILPMCPPNVRVMPWCKTFASFKPGVNPGYCWEPVIVRGGRNLGRDVPTVRDWIAEPITLMRGFPGAKPEKFCWWLFDVLGMRPDDEFHDLFPGSGAVSRAWEEWRARPMLPLATPMATASFLSVGPGGVDPDTSEEPL
jgi:hypothetical protein